MLKHFLTSTVFVTFLAAQAGAQATPSAAPQTPPVSTAEASKPAIGPNEVLASELIGKSIYESEAQDAQEIASISDVLLNEEGQVVSVILETGGFFGLGGNRYAVPMERLEVRRKPDNANDFTLISNLQKADLEKLTPFVSDRLAEKGDKDAANQTTGSATSTTREAIDHNRYTEQVAYETLSADKLEGLRVLGANYEDVGEISDVLVSNEGKVEALVVDVGGFLGMGEKPVAIAFKDLDVRRDEDGDMVLFTPFTQEKLEASKTYTEDTYKANPAEVLVHVK